MWRRGHRQRIGTVLFVRRNRGEAKMLGLAIIVLFLFLVGARIVSELRG